MSQEAPKVELRFSLDINTIRKVFILLDEEVPTDQEILEKMNNHVLDVTTLLSDAESKQAILAFAAMAVGSSFGK